MSCSVLRTASEPTAGSFLQGGHSMHASECVRMVLREATTYVPANDSAQLRSVQQASPTGYSSALY